MSVSLHQTRVITLRGLLLFMLVMISGCASLRPQIETPRLAIVLEWARSVVESSGA